MPFPSRSELVGLPDAVRLARADELPLIASIGADAGTLYGEHGIHFGLARTHPFVVAMHVRWSAAIADGRLWLALDAMHTPVAFVACSHLDDAPYIEQLSVRRSHMRRGFGKRLLAVASLWSMRQDLWLTTYGHVPWNGPYYRSMGFEVVPAPEQGPCLRAVLAQQRKFLPFPEQRIAMRRRASR